MTHAPRFQFVLALVLVGLVSFMSPVFAAPPPPPPAPAPTAALTAGSTAPVGGVTDVVVPAAGGTDSTGAVTGWVTGTHDKIKFTVTDQNSATSIITINGSPYTSGTDYTIAATSSLTIVVTTSKNGNFTTGVRTFIVSVAPAPTFTLTVNVTGNGTVAKSPDQATYDGGSTVDLTPGAGNGYVFTGWSGDATGTTSPLTVTMDADKTITATFSVPPVLTSITVSPANPEITLGHTEQFTAQGFDQFSAPFATSFTWTSSNNASTTIDTGTGLATSVAVGTVTITATSGSVTGTTTLNVLPLSGDTSLASLTISSGTLSPAFSTSTATTTYTGNLPFGTNVAPTIGASATNQYASVHIDQATDVTASSTLSTRTGTVVVTAENGNTATTTVVFTVAGSPTSASISADTTTKGASVLAPGTVHLTITVKDTEGHLVPDGTTVDLASDFGVVGLNTTSVDGVVSRTLTATSTGSAHLQVYSGGPALILSGDTTITFVPPATDASLSALSLSLGILHPSFASSTLAYEVTLPFETSEVPTTFATTTDSNASRIITPAGNVNGTTTVAVTAEDATTTQSYTIHFSVAAEPDTTAPVITLLGNATVDLKVGASYSDAGATASDNQDGNLTGSIVVGGLPINTSVAGTYHVTYNVTDSSSNHATEVTRTVIVSSTTVHHGSTGGSVGGGSVFVPPPSTTDTGGATGGEGLVPGISNITPEQFAANGALADHYLALFQAGAAGQGSGTATNGNTTVPAPENTPVVSPVVSPETTPSPSGSESPTVEPTNSPDTTGQTASVLSALGSLITLGTNNTAVGVVVVIVILGLLAYFFLI